VAAWWAVRAAQEEVDSTPVIFAMVSVGKVQMKRR
jgi:hypothetical protein